MEALLFCTLIGRKGSFPVAFIPDQNIYDFKCAIKLMKPELKPIDPDDIELYHVDLDESKEGERRKVFEAITKALDPPPILHGSFTLMDYFPDGPTARRVQVVVSPRESRDPRPCGCNVTEIVLFLPLYVATSIIGPGAVPIAPPSAPDSMDVDQESSESFNGLLYRR